MFNQAQNLLFDADLITELPNLTYVKDSENRYVTCSSLFADLWQLESKAAIKGMKDEDILQNSFDFKDDNFSLKNYVQSFDDEAEQVLNGKILCILDAHYYKDNFRIFLSYKSPLTRDKKISGVFCNTIEIIEPTMNNIKPYMNNPNVQISKFTLNNINKYFSAPIEAYQLSKRELECLAYTLKGYTSKMIGCQINISRKTVEFHISNIKKKLGCYSKASLIEIIVKEHKTNSFWGRHLDFLAVNS